MLSCSGRLAPIMPPKTSAMRLHPYHVAGTAAVRPPPSEPRTDDGAVDLGARNQSRPIPMWKGLGMVGDKQIGKQSVSDDICGMREEVPDRCRAGPKPVPCGAEWDPALAQRDAASMVDVGRAAN